MSPDVSLILERLIRMPSIEPKSDTRRIARFATIAIGVLRLAAIVWTLLEQRKDPPGGDHHQAPAGSTR